MLLETERNWPDGFRLLSIGENVIPGAIESLSDEERQAVLKNGWSDRKFYIFVDTNPSGESR